MIDIDMNSKKILGNISEFNGRIQYITLKVKMHKGISPPINLELGGKTMVEVVETYIIYADNYIYDQDNHHIILINPRLVSMNANYD